MKFIGKHLTLIGILLLTIFVGAAAGLDSAVPTRLQRPSKKENTGQQYICPMHADVVSAKPGTCPKCGMALTAVAKAENSNVPARSGCGAAEQHGCCPKKPEASKLTLPPGHPPIDMPQAHAGCSAASVAAPSPATSSK